MAIIVASTDIYKYIYIYIYIFVCMYVCINNIFDQHVICVKLKEMESVRATDWV